MSASLSPSLSSSISPSVSDSASLSASASPTPSASISPSVSPSVGFEYLLDFPAKLKRKPRTLLVQFGDGYSQRASDGINTNLATYSLQAGGLPASVGEDIDTFLSGLNGVDSFSWVPPNPNSVEGKYICKEWDVSWDDEDEATFSAIFIEVIEL